MVSKVAERAASDTLHSCIVFIRHVGSRTVF